MGYCIDSSAEISTTGVDQPESVMALPWVHAGVFHRACLRLFGTVGIVRSWFVMVRLIVAIVG